MNHHRLKGYRLIDSNKIANLYSISNMNCQNQQHPLTFLLYTGISKLLFRVIYNSKRWVIRWWNGNLSEGMPIPPSSFWSIFSSHFFVCINCDRTFYIKTQFDWFCLKTNETQEVDPTYCLYILEKNMKKFR